MEIRNTEPSRYFHATGGGAGLNFDHPCGHGKPALSLHLLGEHGDSSDDIGILLPSCAAPALFGAAIAYIEACHGSAAGEEFMAELLAGKERAAQVLEKRRADYEASMRACCQAGFFTQGREHTCRSTS
ncbi:hypothetical protein [Streptomyces canus]|uniref:hypothetical protein n=1 Tax=Streptomyces canus TaxID=58343 RepID=UPI00386D9D5F|nr:hypothetical protein OH824_17685 [Streptomyces canus]